MSKGKKRKPNSGNPAKPTQEPDGGNWWTWVRTEPTLDGKSWMVTLEFDQDKALALAGSTQVFGYVTGVMDACGRAEYDAAVYHQMTDLDKGEGSEQRALHIVRDLRQDRPDLPVFNGVLALEPGVNARREPFLTLKWNDEPFAQWETHNARQHAMHILDAFVVADHDAAYLRYLRTNIGLEEGVARAVVAKLADFRH